MKLSAFKKHLEGMTALTFVLPDGTAVNEHFHVTEVGQVTKYFMDCGGTVRNETVVNFQLWEADDIDHRLAPQKLMSIIALSESQLQLIDAEIEVEYQGTTTIQKYGVAFENGRFALLALQTNCLAPDKCGVPAIKQKRNLSELQNTEASCCKPGSGCC